MTPTLLIADDEKHTREGLQLALENQYEVYIANSGEEAIRLMDIETFDVVLTDLRMGRVSGMKVIEKAKQVSQPPFVIMITAYGDVETAVQAMKQGAFDFVTKPVNLEKLEILIKRSLKTRKLEEENQGLRNLLQEKSKFEGIIGKAPAFQSIMDQVNRVAPAKTTVLLQGETGTGKELIANAIHENSPRKKGPFIPVHCAALSANVLESELFGHEKGAFTGATERRLGRFEIADGGTLFLDELGEIDAATQVKLLRFLETKSFERLGSNRSISVDIRLVCATNRNLEKMVKNNQFREDLLYRLNVVEIILPPLRERQQDIQPLLEHYSQTLAKENGVKPVEFLPEIIETLKTYSWPGNIRELRNFCENTVVMRQGKKLTTADLDPKFHSPSNHSTSNLETFPKSLPNSLGLSKEDNEKKLYREALIKTEGNRTKAAQLLGVSRRTLQRKLLIWSDLGL